VDNNELLFPKNQVKKLKHNIPPFSVSDQELSFHYPGMSIECLSRELCSNGTSSEISSETWIQYLKENIIYFNAANCCATL
jgi:hypothetical protein